MKEQHNNVLMQQNRNVLIKIRSYKIIAHYSEFFQRNDKIMTNSEIEPFPSYSPSQRTNIYKIILINYRWDGELMLERGLRPLSNYFPFPSGLMESQQNRLPLGKGQGQGYRESFSTRKNKIVSCEKKPILRTLTTHQEILNCLPQAISVYSLHFWVVSCP